MSKIAVHYTNGQVREFSGAIDMIAWLYARFLEQPHVADVRYV
jgi:hypothetical protein